MYSRHKACPYLSHPTLSCCPLYTRPPTTPSTQYAILLKPAGRPNITHLSAVAAGSNTSATVTTFDELGGPISNLTKTGPHQITLDIAHTYGYPGMQYRPTCQYNYTVRLGFLTSDLEPACTTTLSFAPFKPCSDCNTHTGVRGMEPQSPNCLHWRHPAASRMHPIHTCRSFKPWTDLRLSLHSHNICLAGAPY
jgi:hypothetical protein